jgi:hypothetical protein
MGQRTQVIVQTIDKANVKKVRVYHIQWGFGRIMPMELMALVIRSMRKNTWNKSYNFHKMHKLNQDGASSTHDVTKETAEYLKVDGKNINDLDVRNIKDVKSIFSHCDNNNGLMVVEIKEGEMEYDQCNFSVGFLLGWEQSNKPCTKFITPRQYMNKFTNYCTEDFIQQFELFCKHFEVGQIKNEKVLVG